MGDKIRSIDLTCKLKFVLCFCHSFVQGHMLVTWCVWYKLSPIVFNDWKGYPTNAYKLDMFGALTNFDGGKQLNPINYGVILLVGLLQVYLIWSFQFSPAWCVWGPKSTFSLIKKN